ncbi:MAG: putative metallopeptidase [Microgenomates group bacterium]
MQKFTNYKIKKNRVDWQPAPDIDKRIKKLVKVLGLSWIREKSIYSFRSKNSKTRACARIWGLSRIWQKALKKNPSYIIEVISEKFDKLSQTEQDKVLLHEISHIPKNFSGSLVPHYRKGKRKFSNKVNGLISKYMKNKRKA